MYHYMKQHPEIYLPPVKEPHFFDVDTNFNKGLKRYLHHYFHGASRFPVRGEATPAYLDKAEKVIPRMKAIFPAPGELKFIVMLRDPVKRAWSHYLHMVRNGKESEPFEQALAEESERLRREPEKWVNYFSQGLYGKYLEAWTGAFNKEQFLFLLTEDLKASPPNTLRTIFRFLEVTEDFVGNYDLKKNVASAPRSKLLMRFLSHSSKIKEAIKFVLPFKLKKRLRNAAYELNLRKLESPGSIPQSIADNLRALYLDDIKKLEGIIGRDLSAWYVRDNTTGMRKSECGVQK